ncbi:MAG: hypothetical protein EXQ69_00080 [Acidimicrobiia bacterium]|nr:hypothetical protein [Acidimicrobiia bacterium]
MSSTSGSEAADPPDLLGLAVRENATWCDVVCQLHRIAPQADADLWWSTRRTPNLYPDAITLTPAVSEFDLLGRIDDATGASVKDSFALLDLAPHGYEPLFDATWIARPPATAPREVHAGFDTVGDKFSFFAWQHAWGGPPDLLLPSLLKVAGVTVVGARSADRFTDGAILHHTRIGGVEVLGISNAFGDLAALADVAAARFPTAWLVGYEHADGLAATLAHGFRAIGPLRVWGRDLRPSSAA